MNAAILSIGTEVTSGQILNSNAANLAAKLSDLGIEVIHHLSVRDELLEIVNGLKYATEKIDLIFITGGLGPTSDDITREAIAYWVEKSLTFDEGSWKHIETILAQRGRVARDIQRKQALFPRGSTIIENPAGTANAFFLRNKNQQIYVLPGPPAEIEALWQTTILESLKKIVPPKPFLLALWHCQGLPESALAELTEEIFKDSNVKIGYRLIAPLIEIKIWIPRERIGELDGQMALLTKKLGENLKMKFGPS